MLAIMATELEEDPPPDVSWSVPIVTGDVPSARGGHTATAYRGKRLIIFGGHCVRGEGRFDYLNDVYILNLESLNWKKKKCKGLPPSGRYGHSATYCDRKIYFFGGRGERKMLFKDVVCLDLKTWEWQTIKTTTPPPSARMDHSATLIGHKIGFFGGWDCKRTHNDFWVFDTETSGWVRPRTAGPTPASRRGHTATLLKDGGLIIFGGYNVTDGQLPRYLQDVMELNLEKMEWTRLCVTGGFPTARFGHRAVLLETQVVVFGGYNGAHKRRAEGQKGLEDNLIALDSRTLEWWKPSSEGFAPGLRYGHSMTPVRSNHFLIFGGWDGTRALNTVVDIAIN